eukprot:10657281-Lingulodinium_polyedra.AAC.1
MCPSLPFALRGRRGPRPKAACTPGARTRPEAAPRALTRQPKPAMQPSGLTASPCIDTSAKNLRCSRPG